MFEEKDKRSPKTITQAVTPLTNSEILRKALKYAAVATAITVILLLLVLMPLHEVAVFQFCLIFGVLMFLLFFLGTQIAEKKKSAALQAQADSLNMEEIRRLEAQIPSAPFLYGAVCLLDTHIFAVNCLNHPTNYSLIPYTDIVGIELFRRCKSIQKKMHQDKCIRFHCKSGIYDVTLDGFDILSREKPVFENWFRERCPSLGNVSLEATNIFV